MIMADPYEQLHNDLCRRARLLHKRCQAREEDALRKVRRAPAMSGLSDTEIVQRLQRKHCFGAIARALGFIDWAHAARCLRGEPEQDMGTFMHRSFGGAHWNVWAASYAEGSAIRREHGGFLLAYRRQFLVVEDTYVEELGLDPRDSDWALIDRDLARSQRRPAWARVAHAAITARLFDS